MLSAPKPAEDARKKSLDVPPKKPLALDPALKDKKLKESAPALPATENKPRPGPAVRRLHSGRDLTRGCSRASGAHQSSTSSFPLSFPSRSAKLGSSKCTLSLSTSLSFPGSPAPPLRFTGAAGPSGLAACTPFRSSFLPEARPCC